MKKRILQLTGSFMNGGSERQAATLAVELKERGKYDIRLAALNCAGILLDEVRAAGFERIPEFTLTSFYNANFARQVWRCAAYMREEGIALIHTHDFYTNVFGTVAASLVRNCVVVTSKRETRGMRSRAQEIVERAAFRKAKKIVANSAAVRDALVRSGVRPESIEVVHNGLDLGRFDTSHDLDLRPEPFAHAPLVTLVANLRHEVKNVPMFIRSAKKVSAAVPAAGFVVAGEGPLLGRLERLADDLDMSDKINFIGRCDDVPALLAASFACVLTSRAEGFANAILEYMAASRPVVATDVGGAAEAIVDGKTGYLVPSDDSDAMAERIIGLINDREKATALGAAGRRVVEERFTRVSQLVKTEALYDSLLQE